jgi:hypothetical protein
VGQVRLSVEPTEAKPPAEDRPVQPVLSVRP